MISDARTFFNFELDTLFLTADLGYALPVFIASLTEKELNNIRFIAVDAELNYAYALGDEWDRILLFFRNSCQGHAIVESIPYRL